MDLLEGEEDVRGDYKLHRDDSGDSAVVCARVDVLGVVGQTLREVAALGCDFFQEWGPLRCGFQGVFLMVDCEVRGKG